MDKMAYNSISDSNHASLTSALTTGGMIRLNCAAGEGQTRANNYFDCGNNALIGIGKDVKALTLDKFHKLTPEQHESLVQAGGEN